MKPNESDRNKMKLNKSDNHNKLPRTCVYATKALIKEKLEQASLGNLYILSNGTLYRVLFGDNY